MQLIKIIAKRFSYGFIGRPNGLGIWWFQLIESCMEHGNCLWKGIQVVTTLENGENISEISF